MLLSFSRILKQSIRLTRGASGSDSHVISRNMSRLMTAAAGRYKNYLDFPVNLQSFCTMYIYSERQRKSWVKRSLLPWAGGTKKYDLPSCHHTLSLEKRSDTAMPLRGELYWPKSALPDNGRRWHYIFRCMSFSRNFLLIHREFTALLPALNTVHIMSGVKLKNH